LLTPNKPEELAIEVIPTCDVFAQGHRIRLDLAGRMEYQVLTCQTLNFAKSE